MLPDKNIFDTTDFTELVLAHLMRCPQFMKKALDLKMQADDVQASSLYGNQVHKIFAEIALEIKDVPISPELSLTYLKHKLDTGVMHSNQTDEAVALWEQCYKIELNSVYMLTQLKGYIQRRREEKAKLELIHDTDKLRDTLSTILVDINSCETEESVDHTQPFKQFTQRPMYSFIPTGFASIDEHIFGLCKQEFGVILGFSGHGKTALACNMALNTAMRKFTTFYLSLEEPSLNIHNRFFANALELPYSELHRGLVGMEGAQKLAEMEPEQRALLTGALHVFDMRDLFPLSTDTITQFLEKKYDETGLKPDVIFIDQLQFMTPCVVNQKNSRWDDQDKLFEELQLFGKHKVGGEHPFALWVLHQVKGKPRRSFTIQDVSGAKSINQKPDLMLGIGRDSQTSNEFSVFSLKSRHAANFEADFTGDLQFMRFRPKAKGNPFESGEQQAPGSNPMKKLIKK